MRPDPTDPILDCFAVGIVAEFGSEEADNQFIAGKERAQAERLERFEWYGSFDNVPIVGDRAGGSVAKEGASYEDGDGVSP